MYIQLNFLDKLRVHYLVSIIRIVIKKKHTSSKISTIFLFKSGVCSPNDATDYRALYVVSSIRPITISIVGFAEDTMGRILAHFYEDTDYLTTLDGREIRGQYA